MNRLLKQIIHLPIKLIFFLFGSINASASKQNLFNRLKSKVFSQWMCLRFNCQNCTFDYPFGYRHGNRFFKIGVGNRFAKHTILTAWSRYKDKTYKPEVTIGNNCIFGGYLHLTCCNSITIGNDVLTVDGLQSRTIAMVNVALMRRIYLQPQDLCGQKGK